MATHIGYPIEMIIMPEVRKITTDNAAAKNAILSNNEPATYGMSLETYPHISSPNGRLSIRGKLSKLSTDRDIPTKKEACGRK
jgi:hypothetical protein